jgi:uncharacterized protein YkwD
MFRILISLMLSFVLLAGCATGPNVNSAGVYKISAGDRDDITFRMLDSVNALRRGAGVAPLQLNSELTASAETHARDMSRQQRAWPFGSDGSSPYQRLRQSGYSGQLIAEVYAQTFETELETLAAWVDNGAWGDEILDPAATDMGFGWQQDNNGLIWWGIILGGRSAEIPGRGF